MRASDNRIMIPARFRVWCRHGLTDGHVLMQRGRRGRALLPVCRAGWSPYRARSSGLCGGRGGWWVLKDRRWVRKKIESERGVPDS